MQEQNKGNINPFFKGISLSDYIKDMNCPEQAQNYSQTEDDSNDLYLQSQPNTKKFPNFAIKQIDEDNYDQSADQNLLIVQPLYNYDLQQSRVIPLDDLKSNRLRNNPIKKIDYKKMKNHSNSPSQKTVSPTKKEMFRSLYGQGFGQQVKTEQIQQLSTLGMSNWRGRHKSLSKKQVQLRDKNKRQYHQIIKYQNVISHRLDQKLNSIRVDGIKDKMHERNERANGKQKVEGRA